jgi:hypothetical protein
MRVSEYYHLDKNQAALDFVDVQLNTDTQLFIDPSALRLLDSDWGHKCRSITQDYFSQVINMIKDADHVKAKNMLGRLHEPNETRLGYSIIKSNGRGMGGSRAKEMWLKLKDSAAVRSGILEDLEDTALMIDGVSSDMISDILTNLIRGQLIQYTGDMCREYGIPTEKVGSGQIWDGTSWTSQYVDLPVVNGKKLLLVPKALVRKNITYQADEYYNLYILEKIQEECIGEGMVRLLKNGDVRPPTKKSLKEKYGLPSKANNLRYTLDGREDILRQYKEDKRDHPRKALSNIEIAEELSSDAPNLQVLINELQNIKPGTEQASDYERIIKDILHELFYPHLMYPETQTKINDGRKRIDITFQNSAQEDFFYWLRTSYCAPYIIIECKNYSHDPVSPELDQLSGRFSPSRGQFGILVCRKIDNKELFEQRCKDTANDGRGYMIGLDDFDIVNLAKAVLNDSPDERLSLLRSKFNNLVM